jgi:hypothetical protein
MVKKEVGQAQTLAENLADAMGEVEEPVAFMGVSILLAGMIGTTIKEDKQVPFLMNLVQNIIGLLGYEVEMTEMEGSYEEDGEDEEDFDIKKYNPNFRTKH